ncbi:uncharacterized protein JCM15063_001759 [Sporobolomyces koalae]|uniref:uncharacterized protein n=1 Tax=Sporobolomyces koalae TaxID=500713 RepID=UPI003172B31F
MSIPAAPSGSRQDPASSSSDFILLTTDSTPLLGSSTIPLARPRFRFIQQLVAAADFVTVLGYGATVPLKQLPFSAVSLNLARPVVVLCAVTSVRVREYAPVLLGQLVVSTLVLLYRLNELVQKYSTSTTTATTATTWMDDVPPIVRHLLNPTTVWYSTSFLFSLLHYILYVVFVGVRSTRNPFVGNARARAASSTDGTTRRGSSRRRRSRRSTWGEQTWQGRQELVCSNRDSSSGRAREGENANNDLREEEDPAEAAAYHARARDSTRAELQDEGEDDEDVNSDEMTESESTSSSSEEDEDDLIDIPKPGHSHQSLRNRASRASLLSLPLPSDTNVRSDALKASRGYGTGI